MWQSQDDIVKDLVSLNDFGNLGDKEPYKVLYSIGRGSKFKEKHKSSEKFLDLRTGEVIDAADEIVDTNYYCKGKGRGSLLGAFSRSKFQLQQQLRLARPLGSGDEAVESYYRRNQPVKGNPTDSLDCELGVKGGQITAGNLTSNLNSDKTKHRIKAVRNSSMENNALINGLLGKCNKNSKIKLTDKEPNFISNFEEENLDKTVNFSNVIVNARCGDSDSIVETDCNGFRTEKSSFSNLSGTTEFLKGECSGKNASLRDTFSSSRKNIKSKRAGHRVTEKSLNFYEEKEERTKEINEIKGSQKYSENKSAKLQHERDEKYRMLGEKLNRLRKVDPKTSESGIYDFSEISRYIAPIDIDSDINSIAVTAIDTVPTHFGLKDFPPLL